MLDELLDLKQIRLELDLTYTALAHACGLKDSSHLYRLLHGQRHPGDRTLFKIRRYLDAHKAPRRRKAS